MHPPIRQTVHLTHGTVTLHAWGGHVVDAYLSDLLTLTATLGAMREQWQDYRRGDMEKPVWASFWRLVHASLDGCTLPHDMTWTDRLTLLEGMWNLNNLEEAEGKIEGLKRRAMTLLIQLRPSPSMSN